MWMKSDDDDVKRVDDFFIDSYFSAPSVGIVDKGQVPKDVKCLQELSGWLILVVKYEKS